MTDDRDGVAAAGAGLDVTATADARLRLRLEAVLPAPTTGVFRALSEPALLGAWWGPLGFSVPRVDLELRPGGSYRFTMQPPDGDAFHLSGEYVRIEPPTALAFTFGWDEPDPDDVETLVAIDLAEADGATHLTVEQGTFATPARTDLHRAGWRDSLERLHRLLTDRP